MRVEVRSQNIARPRAVCAHAARRLGLAVRRFDERIRAARIHIADLNGPRGGIDKRCRIQLEGRALHLTIEGLGADPYSAIEDAIDRAAHAVRRAMDKERTLETDARRIVERLAT